MKYPLSITRSLAPKGWTLVELLVAMALGLLIIAGIGQIYLAAKRSYNIQTSIAQLQEVGRYATEVLTQDIRRAGYWGLMNLDAINVAANGAQIFPTTGLLFPPYGTCPNGNSEWGRMITEKVVGLNDTAAGYDCLGTNWKRGDILTVRYADPSPITSYDPDALYVHTAPLEASLVFGNPANCQSSASPPGCIFLDYVDDTSFPPTTNTYKVVAHAYYVADSIKATQCGDSSAPALPALARETLSSAPSTPGLPVKSELVTGVEQLQFQYGVDTDLPSDGAVNLYMNANAVGTWNPVASAVVNWQAVHSVRFWVLVRGDCPDGSYTDNSTYTMGDVSYTPNDHFRRTLYTSTVALRN
jgi:type IV pilus assembly protein PilW